MIEIKDLCRSYDDNLIFKNQSIKFNDGYIYALIGTNGIGKTTLLESIINPSLIDSGKILVDQLDYKELYFKKNIFYVPDAKDMFLNLTGREYLRFISSIYDATYSENNILIEKFSLDLEVNFLDKFIFEYSRGMKQKVYLLAAFISGASNLILDEPFNGIDPSGVIELKKIIENQRIQGKTIIFSSHNLDLISNFCDKIVIINRQRKLLEIENNIGFNELEKVFTLECRKNF